MFDFCAAFDCLITILSRTSRVLVPSPNIARMMTHIWVPSPNCALSWVLVHFRIRSRMFGQVRVVRVTHTNSPADRSPARVQRWPSAGTRRGQYAGSALLRNEAVHTVLPGPRSRAVWSFSRKARALVASRWGGVGGQRSQRINLTQTVSR